MAHISEGSVAVAHKPNGPEESASVKLGPAESPMPDGLAVAHMPEFDLDGKDKNSFDQDGLDMIKMPKPEVANRTDSASESEVPATLPNGPKESPAKSPSPELASTRTAST